MNSKIDIKICTIDMLTDLQYLCRTTFYETFSDSTDEEDMRKFLAETYSAEKLSAELANSESVTFIAYKNGTPLGYLKMNIGNAQTEKCLDNALEIQRIYILKSAKGQGIGSAFMQIAENFASEKNFQQYGSVCGNITSLQRNSTNQKDMKNFHITHLSLVTICKLISF